MASLRSGMRAALSYFGTCIFRYGTANGGMDSHKAGDQQDRPAQQEVDADGLAAFAAKIVEAEFETDSRAPQHLPRWRSFETRACPGRARTTRQRTRRQ